MLAGADIKRSLDKPQVRECGGYLISLSESPKHATVLESYSH